MATKQTTKKSSAKSAPKVEPKKTVAKSAPKKVVAKTSVTSASVKSSVSKSVEQSANNASKNSLKVKKSYVILILVIVGVGALLYFLRGFFVAAVVNGQPISRMEIISQAEKQSGKQALTTMVRNALIEQEAKKQNVSVNDKEVNDEVKKLEETLTKQGQKIDQVLSVQGMTREDLNKLIRLDKLVSKMVGKDVTVTDKEVDAYIEQNKDLLPKDQKEEDVKKSVREQLKQQATNQKVKVWLEDLQKKSKVIYFVQY
jgi:hypothetical protein